MKVVFLEEVEGTASPGDVKNVANGFARNYLLPRKLAAPANDHYIAIANAKATKHAKRQDRLDDEARSHLLPKVEGASVSIEVRVGEQEKLFGSVGSRDIAQALTEATGIEIQHQQVLLGQAIREVGADEVKVRLTKNVIATVTVNVTAMGVEEEEATEEAAPEAAEAAKDSDDEASVEEGTEAEAEAEESAEAEAEEAAEVLAEDAAEADSEEDDEDTAGID
jgi:large subunit ribosomal protein L9